MLSLKVVSPRGIVFEGDVDFLALPGTAGQLGILPNHAPLFSSLKKGQIRLKQKETVKTFTVSGGFVEVLKNKITVLEITDYREQRTEKA